MQRSLFPLSAFGVQASGEARLDLEQRYAPLMHEALDMGRLVSYVGNKKEPGLRLYRYKEAFSAALVRHFLHQFRRPDNKGLVFDPFSGMGTTAFSAMQEGMGGVGIDRLPVAVTVAKAVSTLPFLEPSVLQRTFEQLQPIVAKLPEASIADDVRIMSLAFPPATLTRLRRWKTAIDQLDEPVRTVFLLLFFAILEPCSYTAKDGQFLRIKQDKIVADPDEALAAKVHEAEEDVLLLSTRRQTSRWIKPSFYEGDARALHSITFQKPPTLVITSPPYANRYDYTRTYSLELCFDVVRNFEEMRALRHSILRSHIEARLGAAEVSPHPAVEEIETALKHKNLNNPRIPAMLRAYFIDMQQVINELGRVMAEGGQVVMVVDNVRFEGEMVPVDLILSDLATKAGFEVKEILIARYKGNSSQQMKKYGRVPVRESILRWEKKA